MPVSRTPRARRSASSSLPSLPSVEVFVGPEFNRSKRRKRRGASGAASVVSVVSCWIGCPHGQILEQELTETTEGEAGNCLLFVIFVSFCGGLCPDRIPTEANEGNEEKAAELSWWSQFCCLLLSVKSVLSAVPCLVSFQGSTESRPTGFGRRPGGTSHVRRPLTSDVFGPVVRRPSSVFGSPVPGHSSLITHH